MKAEELADHLMKHPDWGVQFLFMQEHDKWFNVVDVGDQAEHKIIVLIGEELPI